MRMPNGALASLAGNIGSRHTAAVADHILVQDRVAETVDRLLAEHRPQVVGLSVMTFQRRTALRLIRRIRLAAPAATIVLGGYDPSLAPEAYADPRSGVDFIVRVEGEHTLKALLDALEDQRGVSDIAGLSFRPLPSLSFVHNAARPVQRL